MSDSLWPHGLQHARLLCPSLSPQACSNSCAFWHFNILGEMSVQVLYPLKVFLVVGVLWVFFFFDCCCWIVEVLYVVVIVQPHSHVRLFVTPWTAACQASLSIKNSRSLLKLMSIESVMHPTISSSVVPFSSHFQSFSASGSFPMSQFFTSGGQTIGVSASTSDLPMSIQGWFS